MMDVFLGGFFVYLTMSSVLLGLAAGLQTHSDVEVTICKEGHGYPWACPGEGDPRNHTRCCRNYSLPACCEERASQACAKAEENSIPPWSFEHPEPSWSVVYCPGIDDPDDFTACCYVDDHSIVCCSHTLLVALICGGFGFMLLLLAVGCIVLIYRGRQDRTRSCMP